jgi:hypothetical protein
MKKMLMINMLMICYIDVDSKEMKPEQIYTETKYLMFSILKELPSTILDELPGSGKEEVDIQKIMELAAKVLIASPNFVLLQFVLIPHIACII